MGADDLYSLYLLSRSNRAKLLGVTVSGSEQYHYTNAPQYVEDVLYLANRPNIPVSSILAANFCGVRKLNMEWDSFLQDITRYKLPNSPNKPLAVSAIELINKICSNSPKKVTLLTLGPLNNVAHVISRYPNIADKIERIIILGGSLHETESISVPYDESWKENSTYNFFIDPCAANIVLTSGIPITLIPLDITNLIPLNRLAIQKYSEPPNSPGAKFVMDVLESSLEEKNQRILTPFWDMVGVMALIHPKIVRTVKMSLRVITEEGPNFGEIIESQEGNLIDVCTYIEPDKFYQIFFDMIND